MKKILFILIILGCVGGMLGATVKAREYRDQALRADSIQAAQDTAHLVFIAAQADSIRDWQLRAIQTELQRDSIDRELQQESVLRARAEARVDTLFMPPDTIQVPVMQDDTIEVYEFSGSDGPFAFKGDARLMPNRSGIFNVRVTQEQAIPVDVRVTCGMEAGIKSANVLLSAHDPFTVLPGEVYQDVHLCNPPSLPAFKFTMKRGIWAAVGFAAGVLTAHWLDDDFHEAKY